MTCSCSNVPKTEHFKIRSFIFIVYITSIYYDFID